MAETGIFAQSVGEMVDGFAPTQMQHTVTHVVTATQMTFDVLPVLFSISLTDCLEMSTLTHTPDVLGLRTNMTPGVPITITLADLDRVLLTMAMLLMDPPTEIVTYHGSQKPLQRR